MAVNVRRMRREELDVVLLSWAKDLGWEPGTYDVDSFWAADPEGFFVAEVEEAGEKTIVGSVSGIAYGDTFGFIGVYIVLEEYRGRGIGLALFRHALDRLKGRNVGLDAVLAQEGNYQKSGFVSYFRSSRYNFPVIKDAEVASGGEASAKVVRILADDYQRILHCDTWVFPETREAFLKQWLSIPGSGTFGHVADDDGELNGYVSVRKSHTGWRIGPLVADSRDIAETLLDAASRHVREASTVDEQPQSINVYIDVPETNKEATDIVSSRGLLPLFTCIRMYTSGEAALDNERIYGITTFELG